MSNHPTATDFFISQMELLDDVTQVLIVTRRADGEMSFDTFGQVACDTLGMAEFVRVAAAENLRRELYEED